MKKTVSTILVFLRARREDILPLVSKCHLFFFFMAVTTVVFAADSSSPEVACGSISGQIMDASGGTISGVKVTLRDQKTGFQQSVTTDQPGVFRFDDLQTAPYYLSTERENFEAVVEEIFLSPNENREIEIELQIASRSIIHERIMVIGDLSKADDIPGSAHYLGGEELEQLRLDFDDIHHLLRQIPGVNIQEEDGYGLRPNIGMRGSGAERSSKITLMEDGILIAPAPYAAPAAYYFPTPGRMEAVEVRKGSSQIKYGPRTNGGALNLVSTTIPNPFRLRGNVGVGENNTGKLHLNLGDSYENVGWMLETYQIANDGFKELDGGGNTGFDIKDYMAKFRLNSDGDSSIYQEFEFKVGKTDQDSNETYLGLTDEDFAQTPYRRYRGSQLDVFRGDHEQIQGRYFVAPFDKFDVTTTVYRNNFKRNWYKLQSVLGTNISKIFDDTEKYTDELAIVKGADSDPDVLRVRANKRDYYSQGFQSVIGLRLNSGETHNSFEFGIRYHEDQEDRLQHEDGFQMVNGTMNLTSNGAPGSQSNRINDAKAWALFFQDKIEWSRLALIPGLRYENVELIRTDFSKSDPNRTGGPTRIGKNSLDVFIPGVGMTFDISDSFGLFGGIHKGFSPPGPGLNEDTEEEKSINYELGLRLDHGSLSLNVAGFVNDYDNLLGVDTLSSGGTGEGDLFNGGEARVVGLEMSGAFDLSQAVDFGFNNPIRFAYTLTDAEFRNSFESDFGPWDNVVAGDELPYLPRHQLEASFGLERNNWRTRIEAVYVSQMRTQAGQGPIIDSRATDAYLVFNLSGEYRLMEEKNRVTLFLSLRNLTGEEYIVARRPAGARPGLPQTIMGGVKFQLGH